MKTRAASALVAILIMLGIGYFGGVWGLTGITMLVVILLALEAQSLLFFTSTSIRIRILFLVSTLIVYSVYVFLPAYSEVGFALTAMVFCSTSLFVKSKFHNLADLSTFQARSILGLFYVGILPALATRLLFLDEGISWFTFLLAVVLSGDTMAYLFGRTIGKRKLMPAVSPKKTIEGAIGGLLGSAIAGILFAQFVFEEQSFVSLLALSVTAGFFAQLGDLFESLLKRVADIKDSGKIMPGHGGMLDRVDGIIFAAPIVLAGAMILT